MQSPPNRISSPADPSEVSLLTTLPPELRNQVYQWLFQYDDPVLIHNADSFHEECQRPGLYGPLMDFYSRYEAEVGTDKEFRHDFHEGLALLSSCRQIHDEASGILYGGNTFVFSRVIRRHDSHPWALHNHKEYFQVNYTGEWLKKIGSQFFRLKKIVINVDTMCLWDGCGHSEDIDFLPLLRLIWKQPEFLKVISFGNTGRILFDDESSDEDTDRDERTNGALVLNNLLTTFAVDDVLDIRKYSFSAHLMIAVNLCTRPGHREEGYVYRKVGRVTERPEFLVSDEGKTLRWKPQEKRHPFGNLPEHTRVQIAKLVLRHPDGVTIDLDTHTIHGLDFSLARTGLVDRQTLGRVLQRLNYTTLKMTSKKAVTTFDNFKALRRLVLKKHHPEVLKTMRSQWRMHNPQTIILEIAPSKVTTLSTIRINIAALIVLLRHPELHPASTIRIALTPPPHTGAPQQTTTISLEKLQRQVFLLLCEIMLQAEEELSESPGLTTTKALLEEMDPFPDIWINGHGNLLHASTTRNTALEFTYGKLSVKELSVLGYSRASSMEWMYKVFKGADQDITYTHVIHVWNDLRFMFYDDWGFRTVPPGLKTFAP
jgi:hypothetical protein